MSEGAPAAEVSRRDHLLVQGVLRLGLGVSVTLMLAGLVLAVAAGEHDPVPVRLSGLASDGSVPDRLMAVGVLVLALTPVFRVVSLIVIWARERDMRFVAVGATVVVVLAAALFLGGG